MDWIIFIVFVLAVFVIELIVQNFFPSYMKKKGENLATKEDVKEITKLTEETQQEFKEGFEKFSTDLHFKYDFYYKQLSGLYSQLYSCVIQSEYVRDLIEAEKGEHLSNDEVPFLSVSPTKHTTQTIKYTPKGEQISGETKIVETSLSKMDIDRVAETIISKGELATPNLLKLAVVYRFYKLVSKDPSISKNVENRIVNVEKQIVITIVKDYNTLRRELKMDYDETEIQSGLLKIIPVDKLNSKSVNEEETDASSDVRITLDPSNAPKLTEAQKKELEQISKLPEDLIGSEAKVDSDCPPLI